MSHVSLIDATQAIADRAALLSQIHGAFGTVPNMFRAVANSPAALRSMWGSFGALGGGSLSAKIGEQIAEEMSAAQAGHASDPNTDAALRFALKLVEQRAQVSGDDVRHLREVGFTDEGIVEIVAHVALNLFTNYVNVALDVPVDFPKVALRRAA